MASYLLLFVTWSLLPCLSTGWRVQPVRPDLHTSMVTQPARQHASISLVMDAGDAGRRRRRRQAQVAGGDQQSRGDFLRSSALKTMGLIVAGSTLATYTGNHKNKAAVASTMPDQGWAAAAVDREGEGEQDLIMRTKTGSSSGGGTSQRPTMMTNGVPAAAARPATTTVMLADKEGEAPSGLTDFLSGLAGGAASRASKELLLHPIDTIKTRLQYARVGGELSSEELFKDLYSGVWPALLVGTPAGAAFFGTKDWLKGVAKAQFGSEYREIVTIAAVFAANLPYWGIRTPAEVIKTRQQTGLANSSVEAVQTLYAEEGLGGLYSGLTSNIAYAFPTDAIKFLVYEALQRRWVSSRGGLKLTPLESSVCGSAASSVAQGGESYAGIVDCLQRISKEEGTAKLFSGLLPRLTRAFLSGAIQFGSYEATKSIFTKKG